MVKIFLGPRKFSEEAFILFPISVVLEYSNVYFSSRGRTKKKNLESNVQEFAEMIALKEKIRV